MAALLESREIYLAPAPKWSPRSIQSFKRGYLVHEINNTVEFRGASMVSTQDIPAAMIDYLVRECRK